jgi:hypothetical protein
MRECLRKREEDKEDEGRERVRQRGVRVRGGVERECVRVREIYKERESVCVCDIYK